MKIKIWTVTNDLGDGSSNCKLFPTEDAATEFAENNEYFPEVNYVVIETEEYEVLT